MAATEILYLTVPEYAAHRKVSKRTVYTWIKAHNLPSVKQGRTRRILWETADRFIDGGGLNPPKAPIEAPAKRTRAKRPEKAQPKPVVVEASKQALHDPA
jgi:excisionase family DNA binding protein